MLGAISGPWAAGIYHVANRGSELIMFILMPIHEVLSSTIASLYVRRDFDKLARTVTRSIRIILLLSLPIVLIGYWFLLTAGSYDRYFKIFDRENIHIIISDDFKNNTAGIYKQALCFLGVNYNFCTDLRIIKPDKSLWSVVVQNFLLSPPHIVKLFSHMIIPDNLRQTLVSSGFIS